MMKSYSKLFTIRGVIQVLEPGKTNGIEIIRLSLMLYIFKKI